MPLPERILDDALEAVGQTPMIRLDKIAAREGLKCNLLGKAEFLSIGGSVKDRIAKRMLEEAEKQGKLIPGQSVIIEATSGIGLALACAIKGYPLIITLPAKMSLEKEATLRSLGAEIVRTPTEAAWDSEESHIGVARRLEREIPHSLVLDQYSNPDNPLAHELGTGPEIIASIKAPSSHPTSGRVDVLVAGAGTGGTITGISRAIKREHNPECIIIGVDPKGSILAVPEELNKPTDSSVYQVEGIGYDFIPKVLSRNAPDVDEWIKTDDEESFTAALDLIRMEGLLVGGSSGSALSGAIRWLKSDAGWNDYGSVQGKNVVVVLPDGIRNYMSKPWFRDGAADPKPTALSALITQVLEQKPTTSGSRL